MKKYFLLIASVLTLISCEKESNIEDPVTPLPELIAGFSRSFFYPESKLTAMVSYPTSIINATAKIADDKSLIIDFNTSYPNGNDNATIVIPFVKIKPDYSGDYPILLSSKVETEVYYQYRLSESAYNKYFPGNSSGTLKISNYNAKLKTLSGEFSFIINSISDPVSGVVNNFRQTDIKINGSFENLKVN